MTNRATATFLIALVLLATFAIGFTGKDPNALRWQFLSLVSIAGMLAWAVRGARVVLSPPVVAVLALVIYICASLLWSPDPQEGIWRARNILIGVSALFMMVFAPRDFLARFASAAMALAIALSLAITWAKPGLRGGMGNENFEAEFLILAAGVSAIGVIAWRNSLVGTLCGIAAFAGMVRSIFFTGSFTGLAGLAAMAVCGVYFVRRRVTDALAVCIAVPVAALIIIPQHLEDALGIRAEFAWNTLAMWLDSPVSGIGLGGYNHQYSTYADKWIDLTGKSELVDLHWYVGAAHNEPAQFLATFGAIGLALGLLAAWQSWKYRHRDGIASISLMVLGAAGAMSLIGFPLQNPATLIPAGLALALGVQWRGAGKTRTIRLGNAGAAGVALFSGALLLSGTLIVLGANSFAKAQATMLRDPRISFVYANQAYRTNPLNHRYRIQLALSLRTLLGSGYKVKVSEKSIDTIFRASFSAAPTLPSLLVARGIYLMQSGRWKDSNEIHDILAILHEKAARHSHTWLLAAWVNGKNGQTGRAQSALDHARDLGAQDKFLIDVARRTGLQVPQTGETKAESR